MICGFILASMRGMEGAIPAEDASAKAALLLVAEAPSLVLLKAIIALSSSAVKVLAAASIIAFFRAGR